MSDMGRDDEVIQEITGELKNIGKKVGDTEKAVRKDLADVRTLAEDSKASADTLKAGQEALVESYAKLEANFKAQEAHAATVEAMVKRIHLGETKGDEPSEVKSALAFKRQLLIEKGKLEPDDIVQISDEEVTKYGNFAKSFKRYLRLHTASMEADEVRALSVGTDPMGGYWVQPAVSARVQTIVYETSPMRQLATVETIGTDKLEVAIDDGEFGSGWVGEQQSRDETSTPTLGAQVILVHEQYAMPFVTQKLLDDAVVDIEAWISRKLAEKFMRAEATAFMTGNGTLKPRGILTYPAGTSRYTIEQINTGNATEITADSLVKMPWNLKDLYVGNASWLFKRSSIGAIALFKAEGGQYLWVPGLQQGARSMSTLVGYPLRTADDMPAIAAGALVAAFGDFRQAYTIVDRLGMTMLRDPITSKGFVKFYSRRRVGGDVVCFEALKLLKVSA